MRFVRPSLSKMAGVRYDIMESMRASDLTSGSAMLMCRKVTHKNLIDSSPLFRKNNLCAVMKWLDDCYFMWYIYIIKSEIHHISQEVIL